MAARDAFLKEYSKALADDAGAMFIGAGVSVGAGYPSWKNLLKDIGDELGVSTADTLDLAALAQWSIRKRAGKTKVLSVIREEIGVDHPVPLPLEIIARLPSRNIWTTNYDRLIERAFAAVRRPLDVVSKDGDLSIRARSGAARLYKMHGTVDVLEDVVISTEDYELYRRKRGAFLPMLQAHLTSFSMLFLGLSFTDPNVRHVLSVIRDAFQASPPEHFAVVRPPQEDEFASRAEYQARLTQHDLWADDLQRYGLQVVEIDAYSEVPQLLRDVERRVAARRVWVSGSWPPGDARALELAEAAEAIGKVIGDLDLSLVCGSGLTIGAAVTTGFLGSLQRAGTWDLERRLLVRPFSQPVHGAAPDMAQWTALRQEMARVSGAVVFIGGSKMDGGVMVDASGVAAERAEADAVGAFLLPIGAYGGMAAQIANELIGGPLPFTGLEARRPTDDELRSLQAPASVGDLAQTVAAILRRFSTGRGA